MTDSKDRWHVLSCAVLAFLIGVLLADLLTGDSGPQPRVAPASARAVALVCVKLHPDPAIGIALVRDIRKGTVVLNIAALAEDVGGMYQVRVGKPRFSIDESLVPAEATKETCERFLATLTHEYVHHEQWLRGGTKELHARLAEGSRLNESQCVQKVMIEVEAYGLSCVRGRRYGWDATRPQCDALDVADRVRDEIEIGGSAFPECRETWRILVRDGSPPPRPKAEEPPPVRAPTRKTAPIYLPPPP